MFAVLFIPDFALQALLRLEPGADRCDIALLDGAHRNAVVAACTAPAAVKGVAPGQSPPQAMARCANIVLRIPSPAAEAEARAALRTAAFSISPSVEETGPGVCTLQVGGLAPDAREKALAGAVRRLGDWGLRAKGGIAPTPLRALYAAREGAPVLSLGESAAMLDHLPLEVADPPPEFIPILAGWGIQTLGQLASLPKAAVAHRLGPAGMALWERAAGEGVRPLNLVAPARVFRVAIDCEQEMETLEPVLFILRRFVDRLALDLENAGMAALELHLDLGLADETVHHHAIRLPEPATGAEILFRTLHTYLEPLRTTAAVVSVALGIDPCRIAIRQQGLFDGALRDPHAFSETLDRATAIVGSGRVGTPRLEDTHRPDAFQLMRPPASLEPDLAGAVPGREPHFDHPARGLLLRRFRPPLPATVELAGRNPAFVWTESIRGAVGALAGPWRGSGEWWQADLAWHREEWDAELEGGGLYRLIRTPEGWFLEGEYD